MIRWQMDIRRPDGTLVYTLMFQATDIRCAMYRVYESLRFIPDILGDVTLTIEPK